MKFIFIIFLLSSCVTPDVKDKRIDALEKQVRKINSDMAELMMEVELLKTSPMPANGIMK